MRSSALTDVGLKRNMNQDFVYASDQKVGCLENLYIVADGMGGHNAGDYASRCAVETIVDYIGSAGEKPPVALLLEAVRAANETVLARSLQDRKLEGMGTTLVAATVQKGCLYVANVGDSRLYILDEDEIVQITRDHSLVEEMVRSGQLAREKARTHPEKNVITSAVGMKSMPKIDCFDAALCPGDIFLICSDGLTNMLEDEEIHRIAMSGENLSEAAQKLIDAANRNGGSDNISVILAQPDEDEV